MTQPHTPGPWRVIQADRLEILGPRDSIGWPASIVYNAGLCSDPESQANARLIAQAPIMAQALRDLLALHIAHHNHPHHAHAREILRAIDGDTNT